MLRELYPVHVIHFQTKNVTGFTHLFELCDEIHLKESECRRYPLRSLTGYTGVPNLTLFAGAGGLQLRHPPAGRGGDGVTAK